MMMMMMMMMYRAGKKDADYNVRTRYGRQRQQHIDERPRCPHVSVNEFTDFFLCTYNIDIIVVVVVVSSL